MLRKRRDFSLPSFRKAAAEQERAVSANSAAEQEEKAAGFRRAAAWQWYARGAGEPVVPTRAAPAFSAAATHGRGARKVGGAGSGGDSAVGCPPLRNAKSLGSSSRFKAEASDPPATSLYDDVDLSGLKTQMCSFVERLPQNATQATERRAPPMNSDDTSAHDSEPQPPPRRPEAKEQAHIHRSSPSSAESRLSSSFRAPASALHRLYRKILPRCSHRGKYRTTAKVFGEPAAADDEREAADDGQYHYHRYIHHHHYHHHHHGLAPEHALSTPRTRRFSENGDIRGRIPSSIYVTSEDIDSEDEETASVHSTIPALRRRNSENCFPDKYSLMKPIPTSAAVKVELTSEENGGPMWPRRQSSDRYLNDIKERILHDERRQRSANGEFRSHHFTKSVRYLQANVAEESARVANGGGGSGASGVYKLSASGSVSANHECKQNSRRRHSASYVDACSQAEELVLEALQKGDAEKAWLPMPLLKNPPLNHRGRRISQEPVYSRQPQCQSPPARAYSLSYHLR